MTKFKSRNGDEMTFVDYYKKVSVKGNEECWPDYIFFPLATWDKYL